MQTVGERWFGERPGASRDSMPRSPTTHAEASRVG
jgi:hypothetical protein